MKLRHRHRRLIALIALFGLLFQQLAMATHACPVEQAGAVAAAASEPPCHETATPDRVRCHSHCHPQQASPDPPPALTVPAAILPPTTWVRAAAWQPTNFRDETRCEVTARATAPPITVRHCTFQI
jgi:hypothetical protein